MIPGANLLNLASRLIRLTPVPYYRYGNRVLNENRIWVSSFYPVTTIPMSVQRVPRDVYMQQGLEFQRNYVSLFASVDLVDLARDAGGDKVLWGGRWFQIESQNTWFEQDGWAKSLAVDIGPCRTNPPDPNEVPKK